MYHIYSLAQCIRHHELTNHEKGRYLLGKARTARKPVQKRGIETRAKLIEAAKQLFIEKGYYKTHGPEIAARAGLATGTFYSYFKDKKDVLMELIRLFYKEAMDRALSILDMNSLKTGDTRSIIREMLRTMVTVHQEQKDIHKAIYPLILMDEAIMALTREEDRKVIDFIAAYFRAHHETISLKDTSAAAELIFRTCDEIVHRILFWGSHSDRGILVSELEDMLYRYLFSSATPS
jgi:AcrR family transcriptional regulator